MDDHIFLKVDFILESCRSILLSVWFGFLPTRPKFSALKSVCIFRLSREGISVGLIS